MIMSLNGECVFMQVGQQSSAGSADVVLVAVVAWDLLYYNQLRQHWGFYSGCDAIRLSVASA